MAAKSYKFCKSHQTVQLQWVNFMVYKLHLDKAVQINEWDEMEWTRISQVTPLTWLLSYFPSLLPKKRCAYSAAAGWMTRPKTTLSPPRLALSPAQMQVLTRQFLWWCPRVRAREDSWFLITLGPDCSSILSLIRQVSFGHSPEIRTSLQLSLQSLAK